MSELQRIATDEAPAAIGPYSQAIAVDGWVYTAGQIALDPETMQLVGDDITAQTAQVFANLKAILHAARCDLSRVVKMTVYLADMGDFAAMNQIYEREFVEHRPARSTFAARELPKGARVEIDCVARMA